MNDPLWLLLGISFIGAGVGGLYTAWRKRGARHFAIAGWALIAASIPVWMVWGGPDRGVAFGLMTLCAVGLMPAATGAVRAPRITRTSNVRATKRAYIAPPLALLRRSGTAFRIIVLSLIGAYALAMALYAILNAIGWQAANAIVLSLFAFPIVWASLACAVSVPSRVKTRWSVALLAPFFGAIIVAGVRVL